MRAAVWLLVALAAGCPSAPPEPPDDDDDDTTEAPTPDDDDDDDATEAPTPDDDDTTDPPDPDRVVEVPHPECADPVPSPGSFTDGLPFSGLDFVHVTDPAYTADFADLMSAFADVVSTGVVAADLDADGIVDLYLTQTVGPNALYWGLGGGVFEPSAAHGAELTAWQSGLANAVDQDSDGLLDLLVGGRDHLRLFRNQGDRTFADVTAEVGLIEPLGWAGGSAWSDWDEDGDLDLFAGGYTNTVDTDGTTSWSATSVTNRLYRNDGAALVDVTEALGDQGEEDGAVLHAVWRDLDHDGDPDLLQVNDFGDIVVNTKLWENGGPSGASWSWTERAVESGLGYLGSPMGALVRDLDGDGWDDLWLSDFGPFSILRSLGPWSWVDATLAWSPTVVLESDDTHWSILDVDLDGDGTPGVFAAFGPIPPIFTGDVPSWPDQWDRFLVPTNDRFGELHYVEIQDEVLPDPMDGLSRGVAMADFDGNGVPDLIVPHVGEPPSLLLGRCTSNERLVVTLQDFQDPNRSGVGARVTVERGALVATQEVSAGSRGTFSGSEPILFFGVGLGPGSARITVEWPRGPAEVFEDVCAHCRVTINRGSPSTGE